MGAASSEARLLGMLVPVGMTPVASKRASVNVDGNNDSVGLPVECNCSLLILVVRNWVSLPIHNIKLGLCVMILGTVQLNAALFESVTRQPFESGVDVKPKAKALDAAS